MFKFFNWFRPLKWSDIEAHPDYLAARTYTKAFNPNVAVDYSWIYEHSRVLFDDVSIMVRNLDIKAENLLKYLAPSSGLIGLALIWINSHGCNELYINVLITIGMAFLVFGIWSCLLSIMVHQQASVPSIENAIELAEYYKDKNRAMASFSTGIMSAIAVKLIVDNRKATYINWAYFFYAIAITITILCIILILW